LTREPRLLLLGCAAAPARTEVIDLAENCPDRVSHELAVLDQTEPVRVRVEVPHLLSGHPDLQVTHVELAGVVVLGIVGFDLGVTVTGLEGRLRLLHYRRLGHRTVVVDLLNVDPFRQAVEVRILEQCRCPGTTVRVCDVAPG